jgi:hypothetical protein
LSAFGKRHLYLDRPGFAFFQLHLILLCILFGGGVRKPPRFKMRWPTYLVAAAVVVGTDASSLHPPVIPLFVRNPYLSTWLGWARGNPWDRWPIFWTGQEVWTHSSRLWDKETNAVSRSASPSLQQCQSPTLCFRLLADLTTPFPKMDKGMTPRSTLELNANGFLVSMFPTQPTLEPPLMLRLPTSHTKYRPPTPT